MATVNVAPISSVILDEKPKRSGRAVAISTYLIICLLCFALAYTGISRRETVSLRFLSHSTFLYAADDHPSADLADQLTKRFHLHTVNLLAPGAGETVFRLTGAHQAASPTLVIPSGDGLEVLSGVVAVNQALQPVRPQESLYQKARWALAFMSGLIVLAIIFEAEISLVAAYLPLLGLVAIGALWGRCLHCSAGGSMLSTLAPVLGLVYLGGGELCSPGRPTPGACSTFASFALPPLSPPCKR